MRGDRATGIMAPKKQQPDVDIDRFGGFPAAGISFLAELGRNNNRDWFEANRRTYEECVRAPALALVAALGRRVAAAFPPVTYPAGGDGDRPCGSTATLASAPTSARTRLRSR